MVFFEITKDPALWVYLIDALICGVGFIIFLWWWIRQRTASEVYAYITFLFLAVAMERVGAISMRVLIYYDIERAEKAIHSLAWVVRTLPGTIIMALMVFRMARRACRTMRLEKKYQYSQPECEDTDLREEENGGDWKSELIS